MKINIFNISIEYDPNHNAIYINDTNKHDLLFEHKFENDLTLKQWMEIVNRYCIIFNHPLIYS